MKKLYYLFFAFLLSLPVIPTFSQAYMRKSEISPSRNINDSRFAVEATVMDDDSWCRVTWPGSFSNPWEIAYDDGEADDYFIYTNAGSMNATKFILTGYPFIVTGGRIYVGDGYFPGPFLGTSFRVLVYDDDGEGGIPGTALDSTDVTVNNYEWVEFEGLTVTITEGSFYLAMKQTAPAPNAAPIGVDMDNPTYFRSYSYFSGSSGWVLSPLQDFMIRAWIYAYNEPSREIDSFEVTRFCCFEIDESPLEGSMEILDTITESEYNDYQWLYSSIGLHAYGIRTHFTGGEWSDYDVSNIVTHICYLPPPSCFYQADTNIFLLIMCPPLDSTGNIPLNFLGYNLYRDMDFLEFIPYPPVPPHPPIGYIDNGLQPGVYQYSLTAVYDLTPYGYPGETGESGGLTIECVIRYGHPLPFLETWALGNFDDNNWLGDGANWSINGQAGNPAPSAEFTWDPIQTDYSFSLESYPFQADSMTEGHIYLDFDLKLENFIATGTEQMLAQVWNWESQVWTTVSTYSNEYGSFSWTSEHLDITDQAMNQVFKVRFEARGEYSVNLLGWFVDNIHVYRTCNPPLNLGANYTINPYGISLNWDSPDEVPVDQWIHWDDGEVSGNSIFAGYDWAVAARWTPDQLNDFEGASITQIAFVPGEGPATYNVRVWSGENAANLLIDQEVIDPVFGQWNYITLNTPLLIDITQELWVGYHIHNDTGFPAGCDDGPANDGYGNWLYWGSWLTLLDANPELDYNWSIAAFIQHDSTSSDPLQYAIYRSDDGNPYFFLDYSNQDYFFDESECDPLGVYHEYKISALYISGNDTCESGYSNEAGDVCEGINDDNQDSSINIYPNPANDLLKIESSEKIEMISIFNSFGELMLRQKVDEKQLEISVKLYPSGVYLVRIGTLSGTVGRKVIIR